MKKLILTIIITSLLMIGVDFAATPNFSFSPISGQQLKLHCNYNFNVVLDPNTQNFNVFASTVKFNSGEVSISHVFINSPLDHNHSGFVAGGNLYRAYGAFLPGQKSSLIMPVATFSFKTITNITSTVLQYTTYTGGVLTFAPDATDDKTNINGYDVASADILQAVYDAQYSFVPYPCVIDTDAPSFANVSPSNGAYHVLSGQRFSALVYDWRGVIDVPGLAPLATNSTHHYRYSGLNMGDLNNYQAVPDSVYVDNQEGVNSGTVKLIVSCPTCVSFGGPYLLSGSDLHLNTWTGDATHNQITWQNKDRGYILRFEDMPYEIEKQVYITGLAVDNPNYASGVNTGYLNLSFNAPRNPIIAPIYPTANATYVDWKNTQQLRFYFSDDWAGIDTGSIKITIPQIMSGIDVLMTGYTYSGSDLIITLSGGAPGAGNAGSYSVQFTGKRNFSSNTGIRITGFVLDLAGNTGLLDMRFYTRPSCEDRGCAAIFQVITLTGDYDGIFDFSGSLLIITGFDLNSPYPYLTGADGDILMCGFPYVGATLTGSIPITDTGNTSVNGLLYTGTKLYITGLNFVVQDGVIIVTP